MKNNLKEKSTIKTFLGMIALMSATSMIATHCTTKDEKTSREMLSPQAKIKIDSSAKDDHNKRVIYLTFDDGPNHGTENLLKILNKRKVCATAFLVGQHASGSYKQKEDLKVLKNDHLVELANHSFNHAHNKYSQFYKNPLSVVFDFEKAKDSLKLNNKIARTPGRNIWRLNAITSTDIKSSSDAANSLQKAGYKVIGWDLEWKPSRKMGLQGGHQAMLKKVDSIFYNDLEKTSRHLVFLTHDQYLSDQDSMKELDLFIEKLQKTNRFVFKKISEYPTINEVYN